MPQITPADYAIWQGLDQRIMGTSPAPGTSPDGTIVPPAASITDSVGGVWTLGTVTTPYGVQILLNNSSTQAGGGSGTKIEWKGGRTYVLNSLGNWYVWAYNSSSPWTQTSAP